MGADNYLNEEAIAAGLSDAEIQIVAKRQLVASLAVAIVIALGVGLTAVMPASHDRAEAGVRKYTLVQQPTFVSAPAQRFASAKSHAIELP